MNYWTIKVYSKDGRTRDIDKWFYSLQKGAQIKLDRRLRFLQTQKNWQSSDLKKRKGIKHIYELRISWQRNQYRPLGFFGPNQGEFTLLIGAQEKGSKLEPVIADEIAGKRRKSIINGEKYAINYF